MSAWDKFKQWTQHFKGAKDSFLTLQGSVEGANESLLGGISTDTILSSRADNPFKTISYEYTKDKAGNIGGTTAAQALNSANLIATNPEMIAFYKRRKEEITQKATAMGRDQTLLTSGNATPESKIRSLLS